MSIMARPLLQTLSFHPTTSSRLAWRASCDFSIQEKMNSNAASLWSPVPSSLRFDMNRLSSNGECKYSSSFCSCWIALASKHVCNLIDTPGHVDFASEVSSASRLCDGALVLVDVWEGVCTQTIAVLRQAWIDRLRPLLVINKMDRLVMELKLSPTEAYHHLNRLIEQVNAVMGSFYASERMEDDLRWREEREKRLAKRSG